MVAVVSDQNVSMFQDRPGLGQFVDRKSRVLVGTAVIEAADGYIQAGRIVPAHFGKEVLGLKVKNNVTHKSSKLIRSRLDGQPLR